MQEKVVAKNVTLYPEDWTIIERVRKEQARPGEWMSISQGIRFILRDWQRLQQAAHATAPQAQGEVG